MAVQQTIHSPLTVGPHRLRNRLVALPVFTGYAYPDGRVSPPLLSHYTRLAASGAAMVVVANTAVSADGGTSMYNLRIDEDRFVHGLETLASTIHNEGALACLQLNHAGRFAKTERPLLASPMDTSNLGYNISSLKDFINAFPFELRLGLTRLLLKMFATWHRSATNQELDIVIEQFGRAARRAQEAGFDMIELHGANGYLLCEFFSPATNKRKSGFGGNSESRMRLPLAVVGEVQRTLPATMSLGFRLMLDEWVPGGVESKAAIALAQALETAGISYLSVSSGTFNSIFKPQVAKKMASEAYQRQVMAKLHRNVGIPTVISGRITTPALANELIAEKTADLIGLGRPLRVDPDWIHKADQPHPQIKLCVNCNFCLKSVILERGFICRRWSAVERLGIELDHLLLTRNYDGVWVIRDRMDLSRFKAGLPALLPPASWFHSKHGMKVIFAGNETPPCGSTAEKDAFMDWIRQQTGGRGGRINAPAINAVTVQEPWNQAILDETKGDDFGLILIGRDENQSWRKRLLYALHHKVVGLISTNSRLHHVAILLDFSAASLLTLNFLRHTYANRSEVSMQFIHAFNGSSQEGIRKRWKTFKKAVGFPIDAPIKLIPSQGNVRASIVDEINGGPYGTIIMGKRGRSGIKRLLLGSVSKAVLRNAHDHSLFLVD